MRMEFLSESSPPKSSGREKIGLPRRWSTRNRNLGRFSTQIPVEIRFGTDSHPLHSNVSLLRPAFTDRRKFLGGNRVSGFTPSSVLPADAARLRFWILLILKFSRNLFELLPSVGDDFGGPSKSRVMHEGLDRLGKIEALLGGGVSEDAQRSGNH